MPLIHPGYTTILTPSAACPLYHYLACWVCNDEALGSKRRKPMGRRPLRVLKFYSCEGWWELCASYLCSPCVKSVKDWIAQGTTLLYSLRLGSVLRIGSSFLRKTPEESDELRTHLKTGPKVRNRVRFNPVFLTPDSHLSGH